MMWWSLFGVVVIPPIISLLSFVVPKEFRRICVMMCLMWGWLVGLMTWTLAWLVL